VATRSPIQEREAAAAHRTFLRWGAALTVFVFADVALSLRRDLPSVLVHAAVIVAAVGVANAYYGVRRRLFLREQAIAAASATSADWLWETDSRGVLTYSSEGVRELLGYEPADVVGRLAQDLLAPDARVEGDKLLARSVDRRAGWDPVELSWLHADGHVVMLQGAAAPILDERGVVTGFRGTRRPITDAMLTARELAAAHKRVLEVLQSTSLPVALQPIVDATTGRLAGVEALTRFGDGRPPDVWFRDAVDTGLGVELDRLTFGSALALFDVLPNDCFLSINATPELLGDPAFHRLLLEPHIPAERLVIEITEHERVRSYDDLDEWLTPVRKRGVRLAVDDTGAGYASLSHVLQLRPDIIKLDRSLVAHLTTDPARRALVTALVLLALELGASVTAEGVETEIELETLAVLGVDHVQGYLLARPTTDHSEWQNWSSRLWLTPGGSTSEG
jgi:PAS domain S-box-containing protein